MQERGGISIGDDSVANTISIGSSTTNKTINIGFGAANHTITMGVNNGTTGVSIFAGSSGINISATGGSTAVSGATGVTVSSTNNAITVSSGTGTVGISTDATNNIVNVGTGAGVKTVTVGSTNTTSATVVQAGSGGVKLGSALYPQSTTINRILFSSANNTVSEISAVNQAVMTSSTTGVPSFTSLATNGQVIIGSTAGNPAAATLSAGSGISITNGSNSITINATGAAGGGLVWADVTGATQTIVAGTGYLADRGGGVAFTLPASGTIGDVFRIAGVQGSWTLAQAAGQQIKFGNKATTVGVTGSLASTNAQDCIECVASNTSASTIWIVISSIGNITVA